MPGRFWAARIHPRIHIPIPFFEFSTLGGFVFKTQGLLLSKVISVAGLLASGVGRARLLAQRVARKKSA